MTSGQKTALSVLITVILFGVFAVLAFAGLFSAVDARFYEPAKISQINTKLNSISQTYDEYIRTLDSRFASGEAAYLKNSAVSSFLDSRADEKTVQQREELTGTLRSETQGLLGIRIVDKNLSSIHFSTFRSDILRENAAENLRAYKDYSEANTPRGNEEIPISELAAQDLNGKIPETTSVYYDGTESRIILSYPVYDKYIVFRGTIIFYVDAMDFVRVLAKKNIVNVGTTSLFLADKESRGFAFGIPSVAVDEFKAPILNAWKQNADSVQKLFAINNSENAAQNYWIMVSALAGKTNGNYSVYVAEIFNDEILSMPFAARIMILVCTFISIFLIVFLIVNLRRDDMTVIRERIRTLQLGVVDEYLKRKSDITWQTISGKRDAVTKEIIASLGRRAKRHPKEVEELINRSWEELLTAMGFQQKAQAQNSTFSAESTEEIKAMLQEILSSGSIKVQAVGIQSAAPAISATPVRPSTPKTVGTDVSAAKGEQGKIRKQSEASHDTEELEELDDVEELDEVEELEELGDVEEVEELEELGDVEELDEVEEVEELADVEELDEVEEVEEVGDVEEVEELADVEELDEVEELEEVGDVEEVEELEELGDTEEASDDVSDNSADDITLLDELNSMVAPSIKPFHTTDEIFDISEDASQDFFAIKKTSPASENKPPRKKSLLSRASQIRTDLRTSSTLNQDDLNTLNNFSIGTLDYRGLDNYDDDEKMNGSYHANYKASNTSKLENNDTYMLDGNPQVITQDKDGIFSINDAIVTSNVVQDNSFKNLVNSVLGK